MRLERMPECHDELYRLLASELRAAFLDRLDRNSETGQAYFCHGYMGGAYEELANIVVELGVARPLAGPQEPEEIDPSPLDKRANLLIAPETLEDEELNERLSGTWKGVPKFDDLLKAYLGFFTILDRLPNSRREFLVPEEFNRAMELLSNAGYAERLANRWKWTGKVAPAMRACFAWTQSDEAFSDLRTAESGKPR